MDGDTLRQARERAGLTQQDLAAQVGVSLRTIGTWERGGSIPQPSRQLLRRMLDIDSPYSAGPAIGSMSDAAILAELMRRHTSRRRQREPIRLSATEAADIDRVAGIIDQIVDQHARQGDTRGADRLREITAQLEAISEDAVGHDVDRGNLDQSVVDRLPDSHVDR